MENKVDIKSLLEKNNMKINNNEPEVNKDNILGAKPEGFDPSKIEGAGSGLGVEVEESEVLEKGGIRGGGVPGNIISAEQMASIEETLKELEESTQAAKAEFDAWNLKQKAERDAEKLNAENRHVVQEGERLSVE